MSAPPRRRNACGPAESTTTWTMSATPPATTPSSKCSAISVLATISRTSPSPTPGSWSPRITACRKTACWSRSIRRTTTRRQSGSKVTGLPDEKIIRIPTSDNFWRMGDTGPCGPCSEIFYDHGPEIPGGPPGTPDADLDRFIEIWNLVFMQFEEGPPGTRVPLPRP